MCQSHSHHKSHLCTYSISTRSNGSQVCEPQCIFNGSLLHPVLRERAFGNATEFRICGFSGLSEDAFMVVSVADLSSSCAFHDALAILDCRLYHPSWTCTSEPKRAFVFSPQDTPLFVFHTWLNSLRAVNVSCHPRVEVQCLVMNRSASVFQLLKISVTVS